MIPLLTEELAKNDQEGEFYSFGPVNEDSVKAFDKYSRHATEPAPCVIDLRRGPRLDEILRSVYGLRLEVIKWICDEETSRPGPQSPVVFLCKDHSQCAAIEEWALVEHGLPGLWFALGIEVIDVSCLKPDRDELGLDDPNELGLDDPKMVNAIKATITSLWHAPLVAMDDRAETLFGQNVFGQNEIRRPAMKEKRFIVIDSEIGRTDSFHEVVVVRPDTYQLEGGLTVEIPGSVLEKTTRYMAERLCGGSDVGWTEMDAQGRWFSDEFGKLLREEVTRVEVFAKIDAVALKHLYGYLRLAWLQNLIFITYDGKSLDAAIAEEEKKKVQHSHPTGGENPA